MAEILRWSGDGLTPGALTTASAGTGDTPPLGIAGLPSIVSAGSRPPAIQAGGSEIAYAAWVLGTRTASAGRVYWTPSALAPSGAPLWFLRVVEGTTIRFQVDMESTGRLNLRDQSAQVLQQGATGVVQPGVTYRVEWAIQSNGTISLSYFEGEGTTPVQQLEGTIPAQHDGVWLGHTAGGAGYTGTMLFDDLLVVDTPTMPGPWVDPNAPAAASPFKYWDGSQYADLNAYVWDGADYIPVTTP